MIGNLYKHKPSGYYLRLVKFRGLSNVNTYLQVDSFNIPIVIKRKWSNHPREQHRLVTGFDNLSPLT
jgi:hypothetical protein|tara:strand:+ start:201 stop:401 length:201 start_codon:yes stop_codon:yes gene_type:complete